MIRRKNTLALSASIALLALGVTSPAPAGAQASPEQIREATAYREETFARTIGLMAYIYAYPVVDYLRLMHLQTTPGGDPQVFAPVNRYHFNTELSEPGGPFAGRSPNRDTLYFQAWYDLTNGPLILHAPDTHGRYYNLDYVDLFSETAAHTGRRTTGTAAQNIYLVGPEWTGTAPEDMKLVRMNTERGLIFGRILVRSEEDLQAARDLAEAFTIDEAPGTEKAAAAPPLPSDVMSTLTFFEIANDYLRDAQIPAGEKAFLEQFDQIGIGPNSEFDIAKISPATRRGLEQAIVEGQKLITEGRLWELRGWAPVKTKIGVYGTDYFQRAAIEYSGLLANMPEEAVYPRYRNDLAGNVLSGTNSYRIVIPADLPVDAFWSLTAYDNATRDLIPNEARIYSVGSRDVDALRRRDDGSAVIAIQNERPEDEGVNWLPVQPEPFYLILRLYQPRPEAFEGGFALPPVEVCDDAGTCRQAGTTSVDGE